METQTQVSRHNKFISAENSIAIYIYIYIVQFIYRSTHPDLRLCWKVQ